MVFKIIPIKNITSFMFNTESSFKSPRTVLLFKSSTVNGPAISKYSWPYGPSLKSCVVIKEKSKNKL